MTDPMPMPSTGGIYHRDPDTGALVLQPEEPAPAAPAILPDALQPDPPVDAPVDAPTKKGR